MFSAKLIEGYSAWTAGAVIGIGIYGSIVLILGAYRRLRNLKRGRIGQPSSKKTNTLEISSCKYKDGSARNYFLCTKDFRAWNIAGAPHGSTMVCTYKCEDIPGRVISLNHNVT